LLKPAAAADDAAPWRKLWPENLVALKPAIVRPALTLAINWPHKRGVPSSCVNRGDSGGQGSYWKRLLGAYTAQVCAPGVLAMTMAMPFLKRSVFDEGMVRMMWDGDSSKGQNWMQLLVMLMLTSKFLELHTVNSLHLRKPENAEVTEASKLSRPSRQVWLEASNSCLSIVHVIGSLGLLSHSPMYL